MKLIARLLVFAAAATLAGSAVAADPAPVNQAAYAPTLGGFQHFVQDTLTPLLASRSWEWNGYELEGQRLHRVLRTRVERVAPRGAGHAAPLRGHLVAHVHVLVDGKVTRVRVLGNAVYDEDPTGWRWDQVLLGLGHGADHYDFASGELR